MGTSAFRKASPILGHSKGRRIGGFFFRSVICVFDEAGEGFQSLSFSIFVSNSSCFLHDL